MSEYQNIIDEYLKCNSVKETAKRCNTYPIKVRRVLITEGLWRSDTSDAIGELFSQGLSTAEIAEQLYTSEKNVQSYLPYTRGTYGAEEKSQEAIRCDNYRKRNQRAAEQQASYSVFDDSDIARVREMSNTIYLDDYKKEKAESDKVFDFESMMSEWDYLDDLEPGFERPAVMRLHLELVTEWDDDDSLWWDEDSERVLHKYGKAKEGITRDVLVPGGMSLHAMHFMINRLFGWQNGHLHDFTLRGEDFEALVENKVGKWTELCGVLFRFPEPGEFSDRYWDDDYSNNLSVKSWLRRKYADSDWDTLSVGDAYPDNLRKVEEFREWIEDDERGKQIFNGAKMKSLTMEDLREIPDIHAEADHLLERLSIGELLYAQNGQSEYRDIRRVKGDLLDILNSYHEVYDDDYESGYFDELAVDADELRTVRESYSSMEKMNYYDPQYLKEQVGRNPERILMSQLGRIVELEDACYDYINEFNPAIVPVSDTLMYHYDYGDGWAVKITCTDGYYIDEIEDDFDYDNCDFDTMMEHIMDMEEEYTFRDIYGNRLPEDICDTLDEVVMCRTPLCIEVDGLSVMDDVGGVGGYVNFLETIHGDDPEEAREMREWARMQGWTGRKSKPENML